MASYHRKQAVWPTYEEIARYMGFRSFATVHEHIANLKRKGYVRQDISRDYGGSHRYAMARTTRLVDIAA